MSRTITGRGTVESRWEAWSIALLPPLALACSHVVVVAPHPDDETLGAGGTLALMGSLGIEIEIVALTDGERGSAAGVPSMSLGRRRRSEAVSALTLLLGARPAIRHVGLHDGRVAAAVDEATAAISSALRSDSWCLAPHHDDGHPDHEAACAAARAACDRTGSRLLEYPIWLWHWAEPRDLDRERSRLHSVSLPEWALDRKRRAIRAFTSQLGAESTSAILPPHVIRRFQRPFEVFAT